MTLHKMLRDCQPKACALSNAFCGHARLIELIEDASLLIDGDSDAGIVDRDREQVPIDHGFYPHLPA